MTLWELILRQIRQRSLSSTLTALSVALGVMLVSAILLLQDQMERHFREPGEGYSIVVGAPGSALQLVLNAVYHMDKSPGLMPLRVWPELEANDSVALAVPYALGDAFRGYRVVATTDALFDARFPHPAGEGEEKLLEGRPFAFDREALFEQLEALGARAIAEEAEEAHEGERDAHEEVAHDEDAGEARDEPAAGGEHVDEDVHEHEDEHEEHDEHAGEARDEPAAGGEHGDEDEHEHEHEDVHGGEHGQVVREAVLGYDVAASLGVAVGSEIEPTHGVEGGTVHEHEHLWTVVGILKPTGTPVDRVVFINLDSFFSIEDHAAGALLPGTDEAGLSSVLVFPRGGVHKAILLGSLNRRPELQVADVSEQLRNLFTIVGSVDVLFLVVAILVVILGILSMLVALYNTMNERRREVAILRALGARRRDVFGAIVGEAALLTALGAAAGLLLGHLLVLAARGYIAEVAGFAPEPFAFLPIEAAVLTLVVLGGALAGLVPAWKAYRTDVAAHLKPLS
ncbi:MAG TPA: ABC transporter permease [Polyangiaceae bacterium LLY-WYZ-15_(1-7)]|nr:hypothetical protein [Myxococcales bacterium]MAT26376.1 hypothetical protein [Sandaracinus sp.]HJK95092.1 ABC transporter permease [Polyangiaceae bacterium LLY-WYZ-15_(1-7)]MBJ70138.1 hypothetical protein [Sandaracinus sp.]HJL04938.1 ABC transporter permease [Polyangiaceae bacterium LLY-WYZ-15_(1-7)]